MVSLVALNRNDLFLTDKKCHLTLSFLVAHPQHCVMSQTLSYFVEQCDWALAGG